MLEPWVAWSASLPTICPVYLCANVGPWGATRRSACPVRPTLRQSRSRHGHVSPLRPGARQRPSYRSGCMFLFYLLGIGLPYRSIFCQFWLCRRRSVSTCAAILVLQCNHLEVAAEHSCCPAVILPFTSRTSLSPRTSPSLMNPFTPPRDACSSPWSVRFPAAVSNGPVSVPPPACS